MRDKCKLVWHNNELTIVMPNGIKIPGITSITVTSEVGHPITASIEMFIGESDESNTRIRDVEDIS